MEGALVAQFMIKTFAMSDFRLEYRRPKTIISVLFVVFFSFGNEEKIRTASNICGPSMFVCLAK
jgi:hypothetical protein